MKKMAATAEAKRAQITQNRRSKSCIFGDRPAKPQKQDHYALRHSQWRRYTSKEKKRTPTPTIRHPREEAAVAVITAAAVGVTAAAAAANRGCCQLLLPLLQTAAAAATDCCCYSLRLLLTAVAAKCGCCCWYCCCRHRRHHQHHHRRSNRLSNSPKPVARVDTHTFQPVQISAFTATLQDARHRSGTL